ncbi:MAG: hypothetical protein WCK02_11965 [Bacteroidota bacterium]
MEYNMLLNTLNIIDYNEFQSNLHNFAPAIGISITLKEINSQPIFQSLINNNSPFFICFNFQNDKSIEKTLLIEHIRRLLLLSFNVNYYKIGNNPVVTIINCNEFADEIKYEIKTEFIKQGYDNIALYQLNENVSAEKANYLHFIKTLESTDIELVNNLFYNNSISNNIIFVHSTIEISKIIIEKIIEIEQQFSNAEQNFYDALTYIKKIENEKYLLISENKILETNLNNEKTYNKLLKKDADNIINWYRDEIEKIKDWYYLQYELLPLWYKRIGHVIKRLTPKNDRTNK